MEDRKKEHQAPPDGGWGWLVCIACLVGNLIDGAISLSFGIILPSLKSHFEEGTGIISFVGSLLSGLVLMTAPLAAIVANRYGLRVTYMIGSFLTATSLLLSTFSPTTSVFTICYGLFNGLGLGFISLVISVACNHYFTKRRALAHGIGKTGISLGSFIFPPLSNYVLNLYGWKSVIYMYAGLALSSAAFGALIRPIISHTNVSKIDDGICEENLPLTIENSGNVNDVLVDHPKNENIISDSCSSNKLEISESVNSKGQELSTKCEESILGKLKLLLRSNSLESQTTTDHETKSLWARLHLSLDLSTWSSPSFILFTSSIVFSHFGWMVYFMFLPSMLMDTKMLSSTQASLVLTSTGITNTISRVLAGLIMDHPKVNPALFMTMGFVSSGIVLIIIPFITNYIVFVILGSVFGLVTAPYNVGTAIVLGIMLPLDKVASAFGILGFAQGGFVIIGPTISGYIYDKTKDFSAIFVTAGILYVFSGISCWTSNYLFAKKKNQKSR